MFEQPNHEKFDNEPEDPKDVPVFTEHGLILKELSDLEKDALKRAIEEVRDEDKE